jgi:2-methylcitrate dehydratase PrpD
VDLIEPIVDHVLDVDYQSIEPETVEVVKKVVIDACGAVIAGSSSGGIERLAGLVKDWGGKEEATVLIYGDRAPAANAVLVNCAMARARDMDDVHEAGGGHLGASFVPAALALAELAQRKVSGREFIVAIATGSDLACRLRKALRTQWGWVTETFAPFGVVAEASQLLGFDRDRTLAAMGLAYTQCSCNSQGVVDGALSVRLQQGIGARGGILAAQFAQIGFNGPKNVLQGVYGLYPLYGRNEYEPDVIMDGLGQRFEIVDTSIKPYPCCKLTHIPISTTIELMKEHSVSPSDIQRITVRTNQAGYDKCYLSPTKRRPQCEVDAQFSIPFTVGLAAMQGKVGLGDFIESNWNNSQLLAIADRVEVVVDADLNKAPGLMSPNVIELETKHMEQFVERVECVKGSPQNPMSLAECIEKFRECAAISARPLDRAKLSEFTRLVANLEEVDDCRALVQLLVP